MSEHINTTTKAVGDVISYSVVIGTLTNVLPPVAALLTIIWTCINIYESNTFGKLVGRKNAEQK
jgi:hypothetical protein